MAKLTERQRELLLLLAGGNSGKEAAQQLGIAWQTARHHMLNARRSLGAQTTTHAVVLALQTGELELSEIGGSR